MPDRGPGPELRDAIARRLPEAPRLTWRLSGTSDQPVCRPGEVDVAAHVRAVDAAGPLDGAGVRTELVRLFEEHLDRTRLLWRMDVLGPVAGGGAVLVRRVPGRRVVAGGPHRMTVDRRSRRIHRGVGRAVNAVLRDHEPGRCGTHRSDVTR